MSDHPDLSDAGDLSWDEGDLPRHEIKVELLLILSEFGRYMYWVNVEMFSYNPEFDMSDSTCKVYFLCDENFL